MKSKTSQHDLIWAALEALVAKHEGRVNSTLVVEAAADPASPLHDHFNWDDEHAGHQYRLMQAGALIRRWKGVIVKVDQQSKSVEVQTTRRAHSTSSARQQEGGGYETVEQIMADPAKRDDLVQTVLRELNAYRKRYREITALATVWQAIDDALDLHSVSSKREGVQPEQRV